MTVTQYIGARYVPVFADPVEWNNTRNYEPLTIVMHEGNSFTSKQYVPVGINITDDAYWAETGNYNAQVEAYRTEVLDYVDDVEALQTTVSGINDRVIDLESLVATHTELELVYDDYHQAVNSWVTVLRLSREKYRLSEFIPFSVTNAPGAQAGNFLAGYEDTVFCAPNLASDYFIRNGEFKVDRNEHWSLLCFKANGEISSVEDYEGEVSAQYLIDQGITDAIWVWEPIILHGIYYDVERIPDDAYGRAGILNNRQPRFIFGWDTNYMYLIAVNGRLPFNNGSSHNESLQLVHDLGIANAVNCDGGGSTQIWLTPNPMNLAIIRDSDSGFPNQSRPKPLSGFKYTEQ